VSYVRYWAHSGMYNPFCLSIGSFIFSFSCFIVHASSESGGVLGEVVMVGLGMGLGWVNLIGKGDSARRPKSVVVAASAFCPHRLISSIYVFKSAEYLRNCPTTELESTRLLLNVGFGGSSRPSTTPEGTSGSLVLSRSLLVVDSMFGPHLCLHSR